MCRNHRLEAVRRRRAAVQGCGGRASGKRATFPKFCARKEEEGDLDHTYIGGQAGVQDPRVIQCHLDINVCLVSSA